MMWQKQNPFTPATSARSRTIHRLSNLLAVMLWCGALAGPSMAEDQTIRFVADERDAAVAERFRLSTHEFRSQSVPWDSKWSKLTPTYRVTFPSPVVTPYEQNNTVHCEYFVPRGSGPHAGVVVLHILGGDFDLSRLFCQSLAMHGVAALFVKMPYYGPRSPDGPQIRMISDDLEQTVNSMTQAVLDIRRAIAWLAAQDEVDASRLGITGISLGGIIAALAGSAEPRLQRVCLILAGGNLEKIILESTETEKIREEWAGRQFDYEAVMGTLRQVDPLTYADQLASRRVVMYNATHDTVIPRSCTEALWRKAGEPEIHWWTANHYSAVWYLPAALLHVSQFFAADESRAVLSP